MRDSVSFEGRPVLAWLVLCLHVFSSALYQGYDIFVKHDNNSALSLSCLGVFPSELHDQLSCY